MDVRVEYHVLISCKDFRKACDDKGRDVVVGDILFMALNSDRVKGSISIMSENIPVLVGDPVYDSTLDEWVHHIDIMFQGEARGFKIIRAKLAQLEWKIQTGIFHLFGIKLPEDYE